jgi:hypothetical protein
VEYTLEVFTDKARLVARDEKMRQDGSVFMDIVWIGEAYNDQVSMLKREAKKATGHSVVKAKINRYDCRMLVSMVSKSDGRYD